MTKAAGLTLLAFGLLCVWSAWANVNPWDKVVGAFTPTTSRPLDPGSPTKKKTSP